MGMKIKKAAAAPRQGNAAAFTGLRFLTCNEDDSDNEPEKDHTECDRHPK